MNHEIQNFSYLGDGLFARLILLVLSYLDEIVSYDISKEIDSKLKKDPAYLSDISLRVLSADTVALSGNREGTQVSVRSRGCVLRS